MRRPADPGRPTVIAEAGLGDSSQAFESLVPLLIGASVAGCAYDRAGLGESDPVTAPVTTADGARDLHAMLEQAGIAPPYVLLAHSIGGWFARVFTAAYPDDVVGLVLIDSSHPDQTARALAVLPPARADEPPALREFRERASLDIPPGPDIGWLDLTASAEEVRASGDLGDRPLVVLSRDPSDPRGQAGLPEPYLKRAADAWLALQDELASLSTNGVQRTVLGAGHAIQVDDPEAVMAGIEDVLAAVAAGPGALPDDPPASVVP